MAWYDDLFGGPDQGGYDIPDLGASIGADSLNANYGESTPTGSDFTSDYSNLFTSSGFGGDLAESLSLTFGDQSSGGGFTVNQDAFAPRTADAGSQGGGLIDRVGSWVDKNPGLTKLGGLFVQGAINGNDKKNAAEALAASRLAELREADKIKQENNARFSQSVSGLRKPGLMGQTKPLQRVGGAPVFNNGQLAR